MPADQQLAAAEAELHERPDRLLAEPRADGLSRGSVILGDVARRSGTWALERPVFLRSAGAGVRERSQRHVLRAPVVAAGRLLTGVASVGAGYLVATSGQRATTTTLTTSGGSSTAQFTSSLSSSSPTSSVQVYGPGPFSTFPASWDDPCGSPVHGNMTTSNDIKLSADPAAANVNLAEIYSKIVNSSAFQALTAGKTWVTTDWIFEESTGPTGSQSEVHADFILVSGDSPVSYPQVGYVLQTGEVVVEYNGPLVASCPPA